MKQLHPRKPDEIVPSLNIQKVAIVLAPNSMK